ncbi:hypothetical protein, partial [Halobacillus sp. BBL2006]|uniref:hypothetical protein n=1 Tax=Halobacillus sp. BBL2006 TaxID=1543706 RepID=UPI0005422C9F
MKPRHYTDEELEKMLKDLPPIDDRQSKQDLYRKISPNLNQSTRKMAPWIMPGMATAAVVLLLAIVIPVFLNMINSNQFEQSTSDQETSQSDSQSENTMESAEMPEEKATINKEHKNAEQANIEEGSSEDSTPYEKAETHVAEDEKIHTAKLNEAQVDTGALPGKNAQVVIPFTIVYENGGSKEKSRFVPNEYGLSESLLSEAKIEIDEQAKEATISFPDNFSVNGSS